METQSEPLVYTEKQMRQLLSAAFDKGYSKGIEEGVAQMSRLRSATPQKPPKPIMGRIGG